MTTSFRPEHKDYLNWLAQKANRNEAAIEELKIRGLVGIWISPTFVNGWANEGGNEHPHQYRLFNKDTLEVRGTLSTATASSGTVAYTLYPPFWPDKNVHLFGSVVVTGSVQIGRLDIDYTNGQVTISF